MANAVPESIVTVEKLLFWLSKGWNVLFIGRAGVGKTSMVREAFMRANIKYRIFSASTMDPWVDFIGVPEKEKDGDGESYLKLVKPRDFQRGDVEAIFFDEFNRSHKKIRNAVMEMIQFHSINDEKMGKLRVVWAAINPDDDEEQQYDVEKLDPAQLDRFHIHVYLPYKPNRKYFLERYNEEITTTAITWWNALPDEAKNKVSPRRLDYALMIWQQGGHLEDVLPVSANVAKLRTALRSTPIMTTLNRLFSEQKNKSKPLADIDAETKNFLADENNYESVVKEIIAKPPLIAFFVPLMPEEKISSLLQTEQMVRSYFLRHFADAPLVRGIMEDIANSDTNTSIAREFARTFQRAKLDQIRSIGSNSKLNPNRAVPYSAHPTNANFGSILLALKSSAMDDTYSRNAIYTKIEDNIPADMPLADAIECLKVVENLVTRSHRKVLERWLNFVAIVNTCVDNLKKASWDFNQFAKEFPKLAAYVVNSDKFYFEFSI